MARPARNRSKTAAKKRRLTSPAPKREASTPWPTIEEFLASEQGEITLGVIHHSSLRYTAIVNDGHTLLVALVRNRGETLHQLLDRLDRALRPALDDQIYVDEINRR
jgi:hypothetical protein